MFLFRQPENKFGALSPFRLTLNDAAMLVDDLFGDHQTQACPAGPFGTEKSLKYFFLGLLVHAATIVDDLIFHGPAFDFL